MSLETTTINNLHTDMVDFYAEHTNKDYPVGIYYVDFSNMYMNHVRPHWHTEMEIDFIKSGTARFAIGEETVTVKEGNAVFINKEQIHSIQPEDKENCIIISILFHSDYLFESKESFLSLKYKNPITANPLFHFALFEQTTRQGGLAIDCVNAILAANLNKSYGYELLTKSHLCNLWIQLLSLPERSSLPPSCSNAGTMDEDRVKQAILYIHANYAKNITLDDIADSIHVSKSECCRCFKRTTHLTPFEYLMKHRIFESARKMQRNDPSADSITALAVSVGFHNSSYYNKIFKKYLGYTPTEYRDIIKRNHRDALSPFGISLARM